MAVSANILLSPNRERSAASRERLDRHLRDAAGGERGGRPGSRSTARMAAASGARSARSVSISYRVNPPPPGARSAFDEFLQFYLDGIQYALEILRTKASPADRETPVDLVTSDSVGQ